MLGSPSCPQRDRTSPWRTASPHRTTGARGACRTQRRDEMDQAHYRRLATDQSLGFHTARVTCCQDPEEAGWQFCPRGAGKAP